MTREEEQSIPSHQTLRKGMESRPASPPAVPKFDPDHFASTQLWAREFVLPLKNVTGPKYGPEYQTLVDELNSQLKQYVGTKVAWEVPVFASAPSGNRVFFVPLQGAISLHTNQTQRGGENYLVLSKDVHEAQEHNTAVVEGKIWEIHVSSDAQVIVSVGIGYFPKAWLHLPPRGEFTLARFDYLDSWVEHVNTFGKEFLAYVQELEKQSSTASLKRRENVLKYLDSVFTQVTEESVGKKIGWEFRIHHKQGNEITLQPIDGSPLRNVSVEFDQSSGSPITPPLCEPVLKIGHHLSPSQAAQLKVGDSVLVEGIIHSVERPEESSRLYLFITLEDVRVVP